MASLFRANLKKTYHYLKRNGLKKTAAAVTERLGKGGSETYQPEVLPEREKALQRKFSLQYLAETRAKGGKPVEFGVLVPCYRTDPRFFTEMVKSVLEQTYPHLRLFLADASEDESLKAILDGYLSQLGEEMGSERVVYHHLGSNEGISVNTNRCLDLAKDAGVDYVALLDHDDLLTPDALYEMLRAIIEGSDAPEVLYSDEDKCDGEAKVFYEPHRKAECEETLLLSNNYICHLLCVKTELADKTRFRAEYDGAQDFDFILRLSEQSGHPVRHVPKVLYHWRCHTDSTAENPESKRYAYDAGLRAMNDALMRRKKFAIGYPLQHLGFYGIAYLGNPMEHEKDLGAMGGRVLFRGLRGTVISGALSAEGDALYGGLPVLHTGYVHRAVLAQDVPALDIRCLKIRPELYEIFEKITGVPYKETPVMSKRYYGLEDARNVAEVLLDSPRDWESVFDWHSLPKNADYLGLSLKLSKAISDEGYLLRYHPEWETVWKR